MMLRNLTENGLNRHNRDAAKKASRYPFPSPTPRALRTSGAPVRSNMCQHVYFVPSTYNCPFARNTVRDGPEDFPLKPPESQ